MYDGQVYSRGVAIPQYFSISVCGCGRIPRYQYLSISVLQYCYLSIPVFHQAQYCSISPFLRLIVLMRWGYNLPQPTDHRPPFHQDPHYFVVAQTRTRRFSRHRCAGNPYKPLGVPLVAWGTERAGGHDRPRSMGCPGKDLPRSNWSPLVVLVRTLLFASGWILHAVGGVFLQGQRSRCSRSYL